MDAHGAEYLAAVEGLAETYGRPLPTVGSVVWFDYGRGLSSGRVLSAAPGPAGPVLRIQRSASEVFDLAADKLRKAPRFFESFPGDLPVEGQEIWFRVQGGQARGVVEQVRPDGLGFLVRSTETGEAFEVQAADVLPF
jgi:hypothetical protein